MPCFKASKFFKREHFGILTGLNNEHFGKCGTFERTVRAVW